MKIFKVLIRVIVIVIIIGLLLTTVGYFTGGYSIRDLANGFVDDSDFEEHDKALGIDVDYIEIDCENNIINLSVSNDDKFHFNYYQAEYYPVDILQEESNLRITAQDTRKMRFFRLRSPSSTVRTIDVKVPTNFSGQINLTTKNGNVMIDKIDNIDNINVITSNGKITIKNMNIPNGIIARTSNGTIDIIDVNTDKLLDLLTSNGKITINNTACDKLIAKSSNGTIQADNVTSEFIDLSTSNGSINAQVIGNSDDYTIDVSTNVGSISLDGLKISSQIINSSASYRLRAKTSNGSINIEFI